MLVAGASVGTCGGASGASSIYSSTILLYHART